MESFVPLRLIQTKGEKKIYDYFLLSVSFFACFFVFCFFFFLSASFPLLSQFFLPFRSFCHCISSCKDALLLLMRLSFDSSSSSLSYHCLLLGRYKDCWIGNEKSEALLSNSSAKLLQLFLIFLLFYRQTFLPSLS